MSELETLRKRFEAGDRGAALEALALFGNVGRPDGQGGMTREWKPLPPWLENAARSALFNAARSGEDSIRRAFGVKVASGSETQAERRRRVSRACVAFGLVLGIQAARHDSGKPYPRFEDAYSLAAGAMGASLEKTKRRCAMARRDRLADTYRDAIERAAQDIYLRIMLAGCYASLAAPALWVLDHWDSHPDLMDRLTQRRFT